MAQSPMLTVFLAALVAAVTEAAPQKERYDPPWWLINLGPILACFVVVVLSTMLALLRLRS